MDELNSRKNKITEEIETKLGEKSKLEEEKSKIEMKLTSVESSLKSLKSAKADLTKHVEEFVTSTRTLLARPGSAVVEEDPSDSSMMDTGDTVARSGQNDGMQYNVGDFVLINPSKPSHIKIVPREKPLEPKRVPSDRTQHEPRTAVNTAGDSRPSQPLGPPLTGCQDNINHSQEGKRGAKLKAEQKMKKIKI